KNLSQNVASEGRLRVGGAQEPECICQYMRIPSTAGARDAERSSSEKVFSSAPRQRRTLLFQPADFPYPQARRVGDRNLRFVEDHAAVHRVVLAQRRPVQIDL